MSDSPESNSSGADPLESVRPYLAMASGILGISAAKAAELAQGLWTQGGDAVGDAVDQGVQAATTTGEQVAALLSPEQVRALVREEVDRVVRRLGFAREDELSSLRREVGRLEQQVGTLRAELDEGLAKQGKKHGNDKDRPKDKDKDKAKDKARGKKHRDDDGGWS
jgi:polyhydroxyalkanoate synthesis regulator phasin